MNYKSIIIKRANNAKAIDEIVAALTNSSENPARAQKDAVYAVYGFLTAREAPEQFSEEDKQKYIDMTDKIIPYRRSGQAATEYWFNVQEESDYFRTPNRAWIEWKGVNKDSHVNDKNNLKMYVTIPNPLANYGFVEHIPELTNMLSDMAGEEWIALKFPAHPSVLASHNDNVIVYFQNPELKNTISGIVNQWLDTIKIPKGERLHGRSEFGEDPAGTSWTKGIAREVVSEIFSQWDPETGNEQTARGLAEQALRKAVEKSRAQQDRIANYRSLIIKRAYETYHSGPEDVDAFTSEGLQKAVRDRATGQGGFWGTYFAKNKKDVAGNPSNLIPYTPSSPKGSIVYSADIPDEDELVHASKSFSEQPPRIQSILRDSGLFNGYINGRDKKFPDYINRSGLAGDIMGNREYAEYLKGLGIPGAAIEHNRYGTMYQIWDFSKVKVLKKEVSK